MSVFILVVKIWNLNTNIGNTQLFDRIDILNRLPIFLPWPASKILLNSLPSTDVAQNIF